MSLPADLQTTVEYPRRCLKGPISSKLVSTIRHLQEFYQLPDLPRALWAYWQHQKDHRLAQIPLQDLQWFPTTLYQQVVVPVKRFQSITEWDFHNIRATGPQPFRQSDPRADWVWVKIDSESRYGILHGHLPGRLRALFRICIPDRGTSERLALVSMASVEKSGQAGDSHGLVTVTVSDPEDIRRDWVVSIKSLVAMAHLIQDRRKKSRWYVNNRIDLWTFNEFY